MKVSNYTPFIEKLTNLGKRLGKNIEEKIVNVGVQICGGKLTDKELDYYDPSSEKEK